MGFFSKGLKSEFETAMVDEPSVFEQLTFYCINDMLHMSFLAGTQVFKAFLAYTTTEL